MDQLQAYITTLLAVFLAPRAQKGWNGYLIPVIVMNVIVLALTGLLLLTIRGAILDLNCVHSAVTPVWLELLILQCLVHVEIVLSVQRESIVSLELIDVLVAQLENFCMMMEPVVNRMIQL